MHILMLSILCTVYRIIVFYTFIDNVRKMYTCTSICFVLCDDIVTWLRMAKNNIDILGMWFCLFTHEDHMLV